MLNSINCQTMKNRNSPPKFATHSLTPLLLTTFRTRAHPFISMLLLLLVSINLRKSIIVFILMNILKLLYYKKIILNMFIKFIYEMIWDIIIMKKNFSGAYYSSDVVSRRFKHLSNVIFLSNTCQMFPFSSHSSMSLLAPAI